MADKPDAPDYSEIDAELETSATFGGGVFCGVREDQFAIAGITYKWPDSIRELTWGVTFSRLGGLSDMDFKDAAAAWFAELAEACNLTFRYVATDRLANILYTAARLDGASGVLADMQIPMPSFTPDSQVLGRFDDSENYVLAENPAQGTIDLYRVGLHETEHALGLGHKPASIQKPALIAPVYSPTLRHLQEADKDELVRRYGRRTVIPAPPPPVVPIPGAVPIVMESTHLLTQGSKTWKCETRQTFTRVV